MEEHENINIGTEDYNREKGESKIMISNCRYFLLLLRAKNKIIFG